MVNTKRVIELIFLSGRSVADISRQLKISEIAFLRRLANLRSFTEKELVMLRKILLIEDDENIMA